MTLPVAFSRESILVALAADRQAQATNDPLRRAQLGLADGVLTTFLTPYVEATTLVVYLAGVKQETGWALSSGTGTDGRDRVVFTLPPASGMVSASADNRAINLPVLDATREDAWQTVVRYMPPGADLANADLLSKLVPIAVRQVKLAFRGRRDQDVPDAFDVAVKADFEWLRSVRDGKVKVPTLTVPSPDTSSGVRVGHEEPVFDPPDGSLE